jgi:signal transduction histidine kinase
LKQEDKARVRSQRAVELLGSAIDVKLSELTESNRQLRRKIFDLYTIFEISRNFNSVLNYQTLVDSFLLTSLGQVGASSAALYLPHGSEGATVRRTKAKGLSGESVGGEEIDLRGRMATYLLAIARPAPIDELAEQFDDRGETSLFSTFPHGLVLPLIFKSHLRGFLVLGGKVTGGTFGADDLEFLTVLANQFVVALENARLYESEKQALDELRRTQRQLVLTEKLAAIGELSAKIAHEVNNPLSIISNYLHLAGRALDNPAQAGANLEIARQELSRIAKIVRQLLDFHRPQKGEKVPIKIKEVVDDVVGLVTWQLQERGIEVIRQSQESLPVVTGSTEQLKQVFLNLIINARDFMPEGGRLTVAIAGSDHDVTVTFTDTGPGIPEEHISRIFEPFFTTKEHAAGTGLGLSVCFGIIKEHGGRIEASNAPGGGGKFDIILPATYVNEGEAC